MRYGLVGAIVPALLDKTIYSYTRKSLPAIDLDKFKERHHAEYKAMIDRTDGIGGMTENMFCMTLYLACYGFAYYKADPEHITTEIFEGMIQSICASDLMAKAYKGKDPFSQKQMEKYEKGAARSQRCVYPMDWKFTFRWDPDVPEYFITYHECGVCKVAAQEKLQFLVPYMCAMDYAMIELKGAKLLRTKTLGSGDDCCDFHVTRTDPVTERAAIR